jgi:hypothetical protein
MAKPPLGIVSQLNSPRNRETEQRRAARYLGSPQIVLLRTLCSIDHCENDSFDGGLKAGPDIYYLGKFRGEMDV